MSNLALSKDRIEKYFGCLRRQPDEGVYALIKSVIDTLQMNAGMWAEGVTNKQDLAGIQSAVTLSAVALGALLSGDEDLGVIYAAHAESAVVATTTRSVIPAIIFAQVCTTQGHSEKSQQWLVDIAPELFRSLDVQHLLLLKELNMYATNDDSFRIYIYSIWSSILLHNGSIDSPSIMQRPGYTETLALLRYHAHIPDHVNLQLVQDCFHDGVLVGTYTLVRRLFNEFRANYQQYHPVFVPDVLNRMECFARQLLQSNQQRRASFNNLYSSLTYCILALGARFARLYHLLQHFKTMLGQHAAQSIDAAGDVTWKIGLSVMAAWLFSDSSEEAQAWLKEAITGVSRLLLTTTNMSEMGQQHLNALRWSCYSLRREITGESSTELLEPKLPDPENYFASFDPKQLEFYFQHAMDEFGQQLRLE